MTQNRNKLLDLLIGNLANAVVHRVLEEAAEDELRRKYYNDELSNSVEIAKNYRKKINPVSEPLPDKDVAEIRERTISKAEAELKLRIAKGYEKINIGSVGEVTDKLLADLKVVSPS